MSAPQAITTSTVRRNIVVWLLTILCFAILGSLLSPETTTPNRRISDADFIKTGTWKYIDLAQYSEGHAIFSRDASSRLSYKLKKTGEIKNITLRIYDYGTGKNVLRVSAGKQSQSIEYGSTKGVYTKTVEFSPPAKADTFQIAIEGIGQASVLIDHASYTQLGRFDIRRLLWQVALFTLFGLSLWFASITVKAPQSSTGRIYQSIDILRGVGVILVVMLHATGYAGLPDLSGKPFLNSTTKQGHFGVEIFYVVSAYTLTYSLASAIRRGQINIISIFWNRRFNRIVPTFLFCILAAFLLRGVLSSGFTSENFFTIIFKYLSMGYVFERDVLQAPIGHSVWWSISTEFQFYVVMPLLFLPVMSHLTQLKMQTRYRYIVATVILIGGLLIGYFSRGALTGKPWLVYTVLYHFDAFAIGIATAIVMMKPHKNIPPSTSVVIDSGAERVNPPSTPLRLANTSPLIKGLLTFLLYAGLIWAVAGSHVIGNALPLPKNFVDTRLFVIFICAGVIYLARKLEDGGASFGGVSWLRILGLLSFIIYLVHVPVFQLIIKLPVPEAIGTDQNYYFWVLLLGLVVSILVSVCIHWIVEKPSLRLNALAERRSVFRAMTTLYVGIVIFVLLLYLARG